MAQTTVRPQVLVVGGTLSSPHTPGLTALYRVLADELGAGDPVNLHFGGLLPLRRTYDAFRREVDRRLGRTPGCADPVPAVLVGHSQAAALIALYLSEHPSDRAVSLGGLIHGLPVANFLSSALDQIGRIVPPARLIHRLVPHIRDFSSQGELLAEVQASLAGIADRITVLVDAGDWIVNPAASHIPGARTIVIVHSDDGLLALSRENPDLHVINVAGNRIFAHLLPLKLRDLIHGLVHQYLEDASVPAA
jgi:hypothetical protein